MDSKERILSVMTKLENKMSNPDISKEELVKTTQAYIKLANLIKTTTVSKEEAKARFKFDIIDRMIGHAVDLTGVVLPAVLKKNYLDKSFALEMNDKIPTTEPYKWVSRNI